MEKIEEYFKDMIIKKGSTLDSFSSLNLPSFIRDWFIKKYQNKDGNIDINLLNEKIKNIYPTKNTWNYFLNKLMVEKQEIKILAKTDFLIDLKTGRVTFSLKEFNIKNEQTYISFNVWNNIKDHILPSLEEVWGILTLKFLPINNKEMKICLMDFKSFKPYKVDTNYFKIMSKNFDLNEWVDVILGACDYRSENMSNLNKLTLIYRLIPFVENNVNLIELAPKGTGKSYMFSNLSKYVWNCSGGIMTRAKMFYDMHLKIHGLVSKYDVVALDEISSIKFSDLDEMKGALKGYLESNIYNVGSMHGEGNASIILLGNIHQELMNINVKMFTEITPLFNDSAILDRFHGFIEGWNIPRMNESFKKNGWALNTEYYMEILHNLRNDPSYENLVRLLIYIPSDSDTRDTKAVIKLTTALTKLLFPYYQDVEDVDINLFNQYCLLPALKMRQIINKQLSLIDKEYQNKEIKISIKKEYMEI